MLIIALRSHFSLIPLQLALLSCYGTHVLPLSPAVFSGTAHQWPGQANNSAFTSASHAQLQSEPAAKAEAMQKTLEGANRALQSCLSSLLPDLHLTQAAECVVKESTEGRCHKMHAFKVVLWIHVRRKAPDLKSSCCFRAWRQTSAMLPSAG